MYYEEFSGTTQNYRACHPRGYVCKNQAQRPGFKRRKRRKHDGGGGICTEIGGIFARCLLKSAKTDELSCKTDELSVETDELSVETGELPGRFCTLSATGSGVSATESGISAHTAVLYSA